LRQDRDAPINPEKLKAAAEGLKQGRFALFSQWPNSYHSVHAIAVRKELINLFFLFYEKQIEKKEAYEAFHH
jgi:ABC-type nitrate/sulfonate/bicarbonate transport system substrate-binding protein